MSYKRHKHLTNLDSIIKAEECRHLARAVFSSEHRVMLKHIAETWERIAADIENRSKRPRLVQIP